MADDRIWVVATARGQLANRKWVDENSLPFQIDKSKLSKRWMKEVTAKEAKALIAKAGGDDVSQDLEDEIAGLKEKLADAEAGRAIAQEAADLLQVEMGDLKDAIAELKKSGAAKADPPKSIAGEKKTPDKSS